MIGFVTPDRWAVIRLEVQGSQERQETIEVIVDTGFNGMLMLQPDVIAHLDLPFAGSTGTLLADGREVDLRFYRMIIIWNQEARDIEVLEAEGAALLGTGLLAGHELRIQVIDGGAVTIEPLSS